MSIESAFVAALPPHARQGLDTAMAINYVVAAVESAVARWPRLDVDAEAVASFVASRIAEGAQAEDLAALELADVVLVVGCITGARGAVDAFIAEHGREVDHARAQAGLSSMPPEEFRQRVLEHLLVARPDGPARISSYRGQGALRRWVAMASTRLAIDLRRSATTRAGTPEPEALAGVLTGVGEMAALRRELVPAFRSAVREILEQLPQEERTLLRLCYVEGLTVTEIARLHGIHRVTMSRTLTRLRQEVGERVVARVAEVKSIRPAELAEVLAHVRSRLDFTLSVLG